MSGTRLRIKICGLIEPEDALAAVEAGADMLGFNFVPGSPRELDLQRALALREALEGTSVELVALFRNPQPARVREVLDALDFDWIQFHGDEAPEDVQGYALRYGLPVIKALRGVDFEIAARFPDATLLVDHPRDFGGSGVDWNWSEARPLIESGRRVMLAGGLTPENVGGALRGLGGILPWAVDVASGIEGDGNRKDISKMGAFIQAVREVVREGEENK